MGSVAVLLGGGTLTGQDIFSLGFDGAGGVSARAGQVVRLNYAVMLSHVGIGPGAQAWSFGMTAKGGTIAGATTAGTLADAVENGGLRDGGFEKTETIDPAKNGGRSGAVSAVVLSLTEGTTLPLQGTESVLALGVDVPEGAEAGLAIVDRFRGSGQPVTSVVTVGGDSRTACNQSTARICLRHQPPITEPIFIRGDANDDGKVDLADPIWIVNDLYRDGPSAVCPVASDANDDGHLDASDAIYLIAYLFRAELGPSEPFPFCGWDPTDRLDEGEEGCDGTLACH